MPQKKCKPECRKHEKYLTVCKDLKVKGNSTLAHADIENLCVQSARAGTVCVNTLKYETNPVVCHDEQSRQARDVNQIVVDSDLNITGTVLAGLVEGIESLSLGGTGARGVRSGNKVTTFKNDVVIKGDLVVEGSVTIDGCLKVRGCIHECYDSDCNSHNSSSDDESS